MSKKIKNLYEFGNFQLNAQDKTLWREEELISLPPKVFDTLLVLVEKQGGVVTKDEILNEVWADTFVEENNLSQNIYTLRQVLGKDENGKTFIETIPRRGYRFASPIRTVKSQISQNEAIATNDKKGILLAEQTRTQVIEEELIEGSDERRAEKPQRSYLMFAFGAILIFAIGLFGYQFFWSQKANISYRDLADIKLQKLTKAGDSYSPTISPDGKFLAYQKNNAAENTLNLKDIESGNDVEIEVEENIKVGFLKFSPNGDQIFFRTPGRPQSSQKIYEVSYFGGQAKLVAEDVWGYFSISPDGKQLAFYRRNPKQNKVFIMIKNLETGEEKSVLEYALPKNLSVHKAPAWSPNGETIAFGPTGKNSSQSQIIFLDIATGKENLIKTKLPRIRQFAFMPDDKHLVLIAARKGTGFQLFRFDYTNGEINKITNDADNYAGLSVTADGKQVVTQQRKLTSSLWFLPDSDLNQANLLIDGTYHALRDLALTKYGKVIYDTKARGTRDLRLTDIKSKISKTLSAEENSRGLHSPVADKNGHVYFVSDQSGSPNIWRINSDATNAKQITLGEKSELNIAPSLSPDDEWLYFIKKSNKSNSIWRKSLKDDKTEKVFEPKDFSITNFCQVSPDGKYLAFHYDKVKNKSSDPTENGKAENFGFLNLSNNKEVKEFEIKTNRPVIRWTNGGKSFDYSQNTKQGGKIWRQDLYNENAPAELVFQLPQERIGQFDWLLNGKDLVIARVKSQSNVVMFQILE